MLRSGTGRAGERKGGKARGKARGKVWTKYGRNMDELWTKHKLTGSSMRDGLWGTYADRWDDVQAGQIGTCRASRYGKV